MLSAYEYIYNPFYGETVTHTMKEEGPRVTMNAEADFAGIWMFERLTR